MWANLKYWFKHHDYAWKYKLCVVLPLFVGLVAIDWITKGLVQGLHSQGTHFILADGFLNFNYIINPGSAYGANAGNVGGSIAIAAVITIITLAIVLLLNDKMWLIAITFILAGSFANLLARAWAPAVDPASNPDYANVKGGVIDFLNWGFGFLGAGGYIFNMADVWVNIGVILLIVFIFVEIGKFIYNANHGKADGLHENEPKADNDPDTFAVRKPKLDETREEYDEPSLTKKQTKAKPRLEKERRENMTDRKATMYEQERIAKDIETNEEAIAHIKAMKAEARRIKAEIKLEKMQRKNEAKSN